ncbi:Alkane hydroxylase MAH1 [Bienertia sinuspersici]
MHLLLTADPSNIHHVKSKRVDNFVKGYKLHEIMDVLGDGIITADSPSWEYHRNAAMSFFNNPDFQPSLVQITQNKILSGLVPLLDNASKHEIEIDLQDLFLRFVYDTSSIIMMNHDPNSLSIDLPYSALLKAVADIERIVFLRHVMPTCLWKFMRWLNVGEERKQEHAWKTLDNFIYNQIYRKREERKEEKGQETQVRVDLLTLFMDKEENLKNPLLPRNNTNDNKFLRDTITNFFLAGGETTSTTLSWFFYFLSKHPQVVHKIKEELRHANMIIINNNNESFIRNSLCETLRLCPPIGYDPTGAMEPTIFPSGHKVTPNTQIIFALHAMGKMKKIWGDNCSEFKPERWIEKGGTIKHEPSYKFSVFGAGPRTCIGKQMAFTQMKVVAATIIQNYHIEVIEQYDRVPKIAMVSRVKNGFKVKVCRCPLILDEGCVLQKSLYIYIYIWPYGGCSYHIFVIVLVFYCNVYMCLLHALCAWSMTHRVSIGCNLIIILLLLRICLLSKLKSMTLFRPSLLLQEKH